MMERRALHRSGLLGNVLQSGEGGGGGRKAGRRKRSARVTVKEDGSDWRSGRSLTCKNSLHREVCACAHVCVFWRTSLSPSATEHEVLI